MARLARLALLLLFACGDDDALLDAAAPLDAGPDGGPDAGPPHVPLPFTPTDATRAYCGERDDAAIEARITEILGELSLDEKVRLLHGESLGTVEGSWRVPGDDRLGIPGLRMLDGPRGVSAVTDRNATAFPVAALRGATFDPALETRVGAAMGEELLSVGADVLLAPTMNVLRHPRWGRAQETYGEDTHHMGEMAVAFIAGVQSTGVLASAKHFAANSIEDTRHEVDVTLDERTLREIYLPHFRRAVAEARVASVMSAYNSVNGFHCDINAHLLREILKDEWQFAGFVESDWILGTHAAGDAILAGLDIEMPFPLHFTNLATQVRRGDLTEHDIDDSVRRVLRAQLCYGLDERERVTDDPSRRETPEHLALAREVARRGIVLLRNTPADGSAPGTPPVLPIGPGVARIAVLGRNADVENIGDTGSSAVRPSSVATALEGLTEMAAAGVVVEHVPGETLDAAAEAVVGAADAVVIVTGLQADDEGEATVGAGDRASLDVPPTEVALIRAVAAIHPAVIVVLEGGSSFVTSAWDGEVEALLHAFYPGQEGGHALAEILYGAHAPAGRLPVSLPERESELPAFDHVSTSVTYGYFHGYRHLAREGTPARHPFGFGLTYTTFERTGLVLSTDTLAPGGALDATVTVTNTGSMRAIDTVQLYVTGIGSRVERSPRDLRAFAQVELDPGASADVTLTVSAADLAFWDETAEAFEVEPIDYDLAIALHSGDPGLTARFRVE